MLCKILMSIGSCLDAVLGRSWPGLVLFSIFVTYLIKNTSACLSDNGVSERCHAVQQQGWVRMLNNIAKSSFVTTGKASQIQATKSCCRFQEKRIDFTFATRYALTSKLCLFVLSAQHEAATIQSEISKIANQIEELKKWENQFEGFLNEQRTQTQNYRTTTEQLESDRQRIEAEIQDAYQKQHSLNDEKNRDLQALSDIELMKNERQEDLTRSRAELDQLKSENSRLETEVKKQRLVANNYQEKLKETGSLSGNVNKKLESSKKKLDEAEKKEIQVRNSLLGKFVDFLRR